MASPSSGLPTLSGGGCPWLVVDNFRVCARSFSEKAFKTKGKGSCLSNAEGKGMDWQLIEKENEIFPAQAITVEKCWQEECKNPLFVLVSLPARSLIVSKKDS